MKPTLCQGLEATYRYRVPTSKTVPRIYEEAPDFQRLVVAVRTRLAQVEGRKLAFEIAAHDGVDEIGRGRHERHVIVAERFLARVTAKSAAAGAGA